MGIIAFNADSIHTALKNLLVAIEQGGDASLANMQTNVRRFSVNGQQEQDGGIIPLTNLVARLRASLASRSVEAKGLYDELTDALDTLEMVISDLNAREDDHSKQSALMLENVHELMESAVTPVAPAPTGAPAQPPGNPTLEQIKATGGTGGATSE